MVMSDYSATSFTYTAYGQLVTLTIFGKGLFHHRQVPRSVLFSAHLI